MTRVMDGCHRSPRSGDCDVSREFLLIRTGASSGIQPLHPPRSEIVHQYWRRAADYAQWDGRLRTKTQFFAAASLTNCVLAHLVSASGAGSPLKTSYGWLYGLGALLHATNVSLAHAVRQGNLAGPRLDARLVSIEQTRVEQHMQLARTHRLYPTLLSELNVLLNRYSFLSTLHFSRAVRWYGRVLARVRADLRAPIEFERQTHREMIGLSLIRAL